MTKSSDLSLWRKVDENPAESSNIKTLSILCQRFFYKIKFSFKRVGMDRNQDTLQPIPADPIDLMVSYPRTLMKKTEKAFGLSAETHILVIEKCPAKTGCRRNEEGRQLSPSG
jgi:hypothetical protein